MGKLANKDSLLRIIDMLRMLPAKPPGITAADLHERLGEEYEIDKRTIERDLKKCEQPFGLVCNAAGKPFGWYWAQGRGLDLPTLSTADALSVRIVEDLLRPLLPKAMLEALEPRFAHARSKLSELANTNHKARWAEKVCHVSPSLPLLPPRIDPAVLATVQEALLLERPIEVLYQGHLVKVAKRYTLHPQGLVQRGVVTYLLAVASFGDTHSDNVYIYALHRILEATIRPGQARRQPGFSLERQVREGRLQFGNGKHVRMEVLVEKPLAEILEETPLSEDQRISARGDRFRVAATVQDTWQLGWWILSQGPSIEVLKPVRLRKMVAEALRSAAARYAED